MAALSSMIETTFVLLSILHINVIVTLRSFYRVLSAVNFVFLNKIQSAQLRIEYAHIQKGFHLCYK